MSDPVSARLAPRVWIACLGAFVAAHMFMFSFAHIAVDMRACVARLEDPLFAVIPWDKRWYLVTHPVYYVFTFGGIGLFVRQAARGDHRPLARFALSLGIQAAMRSVIMVLIPLCRYTRQAGTVVLTEIPTVDLGLFRLPWRTWATNDLVFSGHVGEFLIMTWLSRQWPRPLRAALIAFQGLQAWGLIATRGHYTVDLVLAVPCAYMAYRMALGALAALDRSLARR
jgi:hypothetical protein